MRHPLAAQLRLEDRLVDQLGAAVARHCGARLLVADVPRALIDLNRRPEDIDWSMIGPGGHNAPQSRSPMPGQRWPSGLGLVPRRVPGLGELWRAPLPRALLEQRIAQVHRAYHDALTQELAAIRARWGVAMLIDLHSMPPLPAPADGSSPAGLVIGDRFGQSCAGALVARAIEVCAISGQPAALNRPYAGGYVLDCHGKPGEEIHAMQIEVDRSLYLDEALDQPGPGFADAVELLNRMVIALAETVVAFGRQAPRPAHASDWPLAAE